MSFTADEIQSLNDILDRKLTAHRREMERYIDQRLQATRRDTEQRLAKVQEELTRATAKKLTDQQQALHAGLRQQLAGQQLALTQSLGAEMRRQQHQQQPQLEAIVGRALAAQLIAVEELLDQRLIEDEGEEGEEGEEGAEGSERELVHRQAPHFDTVEVQTELSWEDLVDAFGHAFDDRFAELQETTRQMSVQWEHHLASRLRGIQAQLQEALPGREARAYHGDLDNMRDVFRSIEQLERIIESMQVAMTANHALLSNRLYHHQHQPPERAHPPLPGHTTVRPASGDHTTADTTRESGT